MVLKIAEDILLCFATLVLNCVVNLPLNPPPSPLFRVGTLTDRGWYIFRKIGLWNFNQGLLSILKRHIEFKKNKIEATSIPKLADLKQRKDLPDCSCKFFTYVTKTRAHLSTYSRKPWNYNDTIIIEIDTMKKSSPLNLKFTFFVTVKTKITLLFSFTHFMLSRKQLKQ